ncbi:hypothetical protein JTB14_033047 [Gonioctena quinquepunctata]|nr:hypothetical protein JTB14_033047 [Gonioctena quinquepunctata]
MILGSIEQPCIRLSKVLEEKPVEPSRHQLCIFCISHKKCSKTFSTKTDYSNSGERIYWTTNIHDSMMISDKPTSMNRL